MYSSVAWMLKHGDAIICTDNNLTGIVLDVLPYGFHYLVDTELACDPPIIRMLANWEGETRTLLVRPQGLRVQEEGFAFPCVRCRNTVSLILPSRSIRLLRQNIVDREFMSPDVMATLEHRLCKGCHAH